MHIIANKVGRARAHNCAPPWGYNMEKVIKQLESMARELGVTPAQVEKFKKELNEFTRIQKRATDLGIATE